MVAVLVHWSILVLVLQEVLVKLLLRSLLNLLGL